MSAKYADVDFLKMKSGNLTGMEFQRLISALNEIKDFNLCLGTYQDVIDKEVEVLIIDDIQRFANMSMRQGTIKQKIENVLFRLKKIVIDRNILLIMGINANGLLPHTEEVEPKDIADCGNIQNYCDVLCAYSREDIECNQGRKNVSKINLFKPFHKRPIFINISPIGKMLEPHVKTVLIEDTIDELTQKAFEDFL